MKFENISYKRRSAWLGLALGSVLLSGCSSNGNEVFDPQDATRTTVSGSIPSGINLRYSAENLDNYGDGSTNKCGETDTKIELNNVTAITMSGIDNNGEWVGVRRSDINNLCSSDADDLIWFAVDNTAVTVQSPTIVRAG